MSDLLHEKERTVRDFARVMGCTCNPEIMITPDLDDPTLHHALLFHDDDCPIEQD
jgi:hypothetical protein